MRIILREDVRDLGRAGELVEVRPGFARNYLLPRKMAVPATEGNLRDFNKRIAAATERQKRERAQALGLVDELRGREVVIHHRAVEGGNRLHGSVTTADVAEAIEEMLGHPVDRRDLEIKRPIRTTGTYQVNLKLMKGMSTPIQVKVFDPTQPEVEPEPPMPAAAAEDPTAAEEQTEVPESDA